MSILYCFALLSWNLRFMYSISLYVYNAVLRSDPDLFHHVNHKSFPKPFLVQLSPYDFFVSPDNCSVHAMFSVLVFTALDCFVW